MASLPLAGAEAPELQVREYRLEKQSELRVDVGYREQCSVVVSIQLSNFPNLHSS